MARTPKSAAPRGRAGPAQAHVPRVHMVGNAHIDPMWIWDWREGMHEVLQTFAAALRHLDETPGLVFCASSAAYYDWVAQVDPVLFERIREAVRVGRWAVVGGQWIEPDCNLPGGESVCRQLLHGQRTLYELFGTTATVGWNVDSFGHAGTLPQLLARSGVHAYVMMRPSDGEGPVRQRVFAWRGVDGTTVTAYRVPFGYSTPSWREDELLRDRARALLEEGSGSDRPLMCLFGIGDHGGGPTRLALETIDELAASTGGEVAFSSPAAYFATLEQVTLPVVEGELQWHAVGCYSSGAELKHAAAAAEVALLTAERTAVLCEALTGHAVTTSDELTGAWRDLLFSQFHDALGGTCTEEATADVLRLLAATHAAADRVTTRAAHALAQQVDTWVAGAEGPEGLEPSAVSGRPVPVIVCNPLSWPVTTTVSVPHPFAAANDERGHAVPVQQITSGEVTYSSTRALLRVELPPLGYRRYWLHLDARGAAEMADAAQPGDAAETRQPASVDDTRLDHIVLDNGLLRVEIDRTSGCMVRLLDRRDGTECLERTGASVVTIDDASDTWSHGVSRYGGPERRPDLEGLAVTEHGPVRSTVTASHRCGSSRIVTSTSVVEGCAFVELRLDVEWHEHHRLLKLVVPVALDDPLTAAGAPYGFAERPAIGHEEPMVHWVGIADRSGCRGLSCTTDSTYGYDADGARLRLTLLRSPRIADHGRGWATGDRGPAFAYPFSDQGRQRCSVRLHPHAGTWADAEVARLADEHVQLVRPPLVLDTWHHGALGPDASMGRVVSGSVSIPVVKRAERARGTIVRIWEVCGRPTSARVVLPPDGRAWEGALGPHELRTLFVPDGGGSVRDVDIPELDLELDLGPAHRPVPA